jgi:hypothetical protein
MRQVGSKQRAGLCSAIACVALAVASCTVQRVPSGDPAATKPASGQAPYDFQKERPSPPAPATGAETAVPPTLDTPAADLGSPGVAVQDLPAPPAPVPAPPANNNAPAVPKATVGGFRIQIMAVTDAATADRTRADIESKFGVKAYIVYQSPYYKVRVGDCPTQDECRGLQDRLRGAGYTTVWLVPDAIQH